MKKRLAGNNLTTNHYTLSTYSGFTLVEVMVVLGLFAILMAAGLIFSLDDYRSYLFHNEKNLLVSALQRARSQAVNNICLGNGCTQGQKHGLRIENDRYVIFQGNSYNASDPQNQVIENNPSMTVTPSSPEIIFNQLSGSTPSEWTLRIQDQIGRDVTIRINQEGRIDW